MSQLFSHKIFTHFVLILAMILWSSSFIALKIALSEYNPFQVLAWRMVFASVFCLPFAKLLLIALKDKGLRTLLIISVLAEPCLYFICETFALRYTSAGQAGMVIALSPLFVGAFAWLLLKEKLSVQTWCGFFVAVLGICWLTLAGEASLSAPNPFLGNALELGAVFCTVAYTLCVRRLTSNVSPHVCTTAMAFGGGLFFMPLALYPFQIDPVMLEVAIPTWLPEAAIVYLGAGVSVFGFGFYNYGLSKLPAGEVVAYINLIPIFTLIMGVLWLDETLKTMQYLACALVVLGIMISQVPTKEKK